VRRSKATTITVVSVQAATKASDTHVPYPFYLCISIFTSCSMHVRCFTQLFLSNA
jgi:hypothetical protein